ncbi:hypothetical protein F4553_003473 [Allocatelliglobosispora scoriae]|uniref:DUF998 domain-containing protein n=1 Tax=Allocatelliglobosispora scoriae TaxID=643052 RepID=A0A841BP95_9ACTN|nr:DUF998 domain-containing protein [Allocatelliglobosispora scoriae]MBB5870094.1 hypothetical protein [Allocatelliglobosispora scoriae]
MTTTTAPTATCDPAIAVTRSLLGYGILAGPFYVVVSVTEALTRSGFDPTRHAWSMLSNGSLGWIHIANFVLTGLMTLAFAIGLRRALGTGAASTWAPRLIAVYAISLIAAGALRADPGNGFPAGTPAGPGPMSWHGTGHFLAGFIGFTSLIVACFVLARRFAADGETRWAWSAWIVGVLFGLGFIAVAAGGGASWSILAFTAAVIMVCAWLAAVALHTYRQAAPQL